MLVSESMSNLSGMVTNVNSVLDDNREPLRGALTSVGEAGEAFQQVASRIDSLADTLQEVTDRLAASRGTIWRMAESDTLYVNLSRTLASLDSFITDLRENPKKYFTIKVF